MSAKDPHSYNTQQEQWAALQPRHQPAYTYPQLPEDRSYLDPQTLPSHEQPSGVTTSSFDYGPTFSQISQSSTLLPSQEQYPHSESSQVQYPSYPHPGYAAGHQQSQHDYFPGSQQPFDSAVPAMPDSSSPAQSVSGTYTSPPPFPHQFSELIQPYDFGARSSLPIVNAPDTLASAFSAFDVSHHHSQTTASNKRQRSEEQEEEEGGDTNAQARGDATQLSAAEKLKRACARCRGLKVCHLTNITNK
jgi:hypothetical protein